MFYCCGWIVVFFFMLVMINYMDCIVLFIVVVFIVVEFKFLMVSMGYLFLLFIWSYVLFLLFMGLLLDCFGMKWIVGFGIFVWFVVIVLIGVVMSFGVLLVVCFVMGGGEFCSNLVGVKVIC